MERDGATSSSGLYGGEIGAGGKFRKPSARKPPPTPYDRPTKVNQSSQSSNRQDGGGWLSKLVDPAYRLISGGATRILPSFFSKPANDLPSSNSQDHEVEQDAGGGDQKSSSNLEISASTRVAVPGRAADGSKCKSDFDEHIQDKRGKLSDDSGFSDIELLMKGKRFSRDEINRLTEILDSRAVDLSHAEQGKKNLSSTVEGEFEGAVAAHNNPRTSIEEKQEDLNRAIWGTSTPLLQSTASRTLDEVGASPVEIARAYMGSRAPDIGLSSKSLILNDERAILHNDEFASKPIFTSPSAKSLCWPGAIIQDQPAYLTPQSERGKFGLHNFPRTPYSRTMYSRSKSKLTQSQGGSSKCFTTSSIPLQRLQTPINRQGKSRGNLLDDGYGSVGPIRRIQHKVDAETPSRGSVYLHSSQNYPSNLEISGSFLPARRKNWEPGATSSTLSFQPVESKSHSFEEGVPTVHPQSSQMARKILDHIDRKVPTREEKFSELKLATAWKTPLHAEVTTLVPNEDKSLPPFGGFNSRKNINLVDQRFSAQGNEDAGNSLLKVQPLERSTNKVNDAVNKNTSASGINLGYASMMLGGNSGPSLDFKKTSESQIKSVHENVFVGFDGHKQQEKSEIWPFQSQINGQDVFKMVPNATGSEVLNLQKHPPSHSSGSKPVLASISIGKPDLRSKVSFDNSYGFTFPVSASSGALSEPPTPSVMPSLSASSLQLPPKVGADVPSYSFGSRKATPALVFSFPSTSSASTQVDASDLKFNFGSDKETRVSFSSVGKDAICY